MYLNPKRLFLTGTKECRYCDRTFSNVNGGDYHTVIEWLISNTLTAYVILIALRIIISGFSPTAFIFSITYWDLPSIWLLLAFTIHRQETIGYDIFVFLSRGQSPGDCLNTFHVHRKDPRGTWLDMENTYTWVDVITHGRCEMIEGQILRIREGGHLFKLLYRIFKKRSYNMILYSNTHPRRIDIFLGINWRASFRRAKLVDSIGKSFGPWRAVEILCLLANNTYHQNLKEYVTMAGKNRALVGVLYEELYTLRYFLNLPKSQIRPGVIGLYIRHRINRLFGEILKDELPIADGSILNSTSGNIKEVVKDFKQMRRELLDKAKQDQGL
ncbi:MAG: hypothetical protein V1838_05575 [Patescibacteria group bacterium]